MEPNETPNGMARASGFSEACLAAIEKRGWKVRATSADRAADLEADMRDLHGSGAIDEDHFAYCMDHWDFDVARAFPGAASLLIIACPSRPRSLSFESGGKSLRVFLPPIFQDRLTFKPSVVEALGAMLSPAGFRIAPARLPSKLLAARAGLARIGRNRIAYVEGMGSFARLEAFVTDLAFPDRGWGDVLAPDSCRTCGACGRACPSGALDGGNGRFDMGRCICYLNEELDDPFPSWADPAWHHALIGCMRCQEACPGNAAFIGSIDEGPSFDARETAELLSFAGGDGEGTLSPSLKGKIAECGLSGLADKLPRNLEALLERA